MLILLNWELIGQCRTCTNILRWVLEILEQKWDTIRFISFEKALELSKNIKSFIPNSLVVKYYTENKKYIKSICKKAKFANDLDVILENQEFFVNGEQKYNQLRYNMFNLIRASDDLYCVNDFKTDNLFDSLTIY